MRYLFTMLLCFLKKDSLYTIVDNIDFSPKEIDILNEDLKKMIILLFLVSLIVLLDERKKTNFLMKGLFGYI